ncbi:DnaJ domain protein [Geopyxis carbonaria]|nr:DnaJ domain protein [Geopyxis carbonaria]
MPPRLYFHNQTTVPIFGRGFSSTARTKFINHYDVLNLHHTASAADIKNRFYELSKRHHPDRNRNDPHSSKRFVKISSAYNILSKTSSREKHDRELGVSKSTDRSTNSPSAAGGRPASGLSRRRTQFHGPPPSFFRNGGWDTFRGKSPGGGTKGKTTGVKGGGIGAGSVGGADNYDVPHFNWDGKYKQHQEHERRRLAKANRGHRGSNIDPGLIIPVLAVSSILFITVWAATYTVQPKKPKPKN